MFRESMWRLARDTPPPVRYWGGDYIVYNTLSGDTHVLDIVAGEALRAIIAGPIASSAICERIASLLEVSSDQRVATNVDAILALLDELGLIEPVDAC
jgi:PqqD family protein of HPr-rel-A system